MGSHTINVHMVKNPRKIHIQQEVSPNILGLYKIQFIGVEDLA